jgi:hypothetical protein
MTKKWTLLLIIIVIVSSLLLGCTKLINTNPIESIKLSEVSKIVFGDGRGGRNKPFILTDRQKIDEFIKMIGNYKIQKEIKHEDATGWIHNAVFYKGNNKLMEITFTNPLNIDGKYYDIIKGELSTEEIDNFIKSANPDWKLP